MPVPGSVHRLTRRFGVSSLVLTLLCSGAWAQSSDLRSTFPGRRVGGGSRGDCTSRLLAHLVPPESVYAPDAQSLLGLLQGPAQIPRPVELSLRPYQSPSDGDAKEKESTRKLFLPAAPAGVTLLTLPAVSQPTVLESHYLCQENPPKDEDPLGFVVNAVPPVVSLLIENSDGTPADRRVQQELGKLKARCGSTVSTAAVGTAFGMEDLLSANWPEELPVRCLQPAAQP